MNQQNAPLQMTLKRCAAVASLATLGACQTARSSTPEILHAAAPAALSTSPVATADDDAPDLIEVLRRKGSLTDEEARGLSAQQQPSGPKVSISGEGLRVKSADGESSIRIGGRLQVDANVHLRDTALDESEIDDGTELRRARWKIDGTLPHDFSYVGEIDVGSNRVSVKDFYLGWDPGTGQDITLGNQKQPFSLSVEMSSNDLPFVERSVDNFLIIPFIDRAIGIRGQHNTDNLFAAGGVFGEGVSATNMDDESWGVAGRLIAAPILADDQVVHLGVRGAFRQPTDGINEVRIRDESTNMSNFSVVDTGAITDVDGTLLYGAEAALVQGPFSIGGEYNVVQIDREGSDYDFSSWHVAATYSLTGESRAKSYRINAGEFKRLQIAPESTCGAWEIAARLANIDLNDSGLSAGEEETGTLSLVCYLNANVRFLLNWSRVLDTGGGSAETAAAEGLDIYSFRTEITF